MFIFAIRMFSLKKSLGQHFLYDENICRKIIASAKNCSPNQLLEVGPGGGALTKYLVELDNIYFKAIEVDAEKVAFLKKKFPSFQDRFIFGDFLDMGISPTIFLPKYFLEYWNGKNIFPV